MAQYAVHKIGFFYTDECFAVGEEKGTVMHITRSLDEARAFKKQEDIASLKRATGIPLEDFYFDSQNRDTIIEQLTDFYQSEFGFTYVDDYPGSELPLQITDEQAVRLLSIMELNFHNIVAYEDEDVIDPAAFSFDQYEGDISGF